MPKRKVSDEEDESASFSDSASSEEEQKLSTKQAKKKKDTPVAKKSKSSSSKQETQDEGSNVKVNAEGDKYVDLGKKKKAVVRSFKGMALLDIREYYDSAGGEKPGKKGISLSLDQWNELKNASETIDKLFSQLKK
ncbi:hypothetical protein CVT24_009417 [Panaeolus cyanescens]|uniref:Transcriptional coactivator p15 (PC4) C-terminal domain-containing protein n=1 Tax=Panaeolus cyanescens TaxID=181874 RepID=A0A409VAR5_9AGAR|nr:hypothetical protein CVT24_009417 [Panaeolus cyanescens]